MGKRSPRGPRFSVLLPTHNRPDVLTYAIHSVLAQTEPDFELLVVGDGCTDDTAEVVQGVADDRLRWFDLPKAPHFGYANRNRCLRAARGELIAYMAHDDLWLSDHLERLSISFENSSVDLTYSRPLWVTPQGLLIPATFDLEDDQIREMFLQRTCNVIPSACVVHRRSCFESVGYWNEALPSAGDWDLWARIIAADGGNLLYDPVPTCLHFRAAWRTEENAGPEGLKAWDRWAEEDLTRAVGLRVEIPEGALEQSVLWSRIHADPVGWPRRLRARVVAAIDRRIHEQDSWPEGREQSALTASVRLRLSDDSTLIEPAQAPVRIDAGALQGSVDALLEHSSGLIVDGWAADVEGGSPVDLVAILLDGRSVSVGQTGRRRPDVAEAFGDIGLARSGFHIGVPRDVLGHRCEASEIRVFAIKGNIASELPYQATGRESC